MREVFAFASFSFCYFAGKNRYETERKMWSVPKGSQLTLAIVKPHVVKAPHALQGVRQAIEENGFKVLATRKVQLSEKEASEFYSEHKGRFFYNRLVNFMISGPIEVQVLAKEDAIKEWRRLLGPTKVFRAIFSEPDSLRGRFGLTDTRNALHGSDSEESAAKEIKFFFPDAIV
ncbi:nucleoside diphosphate kinase 6 [Neocloeon triangulifer]|uniref:nucleoside diphosphate kinase 6 n=1 Tax=Neocloeon triangulifer TaxID=2078957 RepID=UPI00286F0F83|nr:nucleoside diphosphate kinase 6 [Neocloeon triangulifer]